MSNKARRMLVLLLIILKEAGPTAACSSSCSWSPLCCARCHCEDRGLTSVPQDLPTNITLLDLEGNNITTLSQSDFSRYRSLTWLDLSSNQISIIHNKTFHNLTSLGGLYLHHNHLTTLSADIFEGLGNLEWLGLQNNNIHSIEAGTFNDTTKLSYLFLQNNNIGTITANIFGNLPQLKMLRLSHNDIKTFPVEALSNLNISALSELTLYSNKLETLPPMAYDIMASISTVHIGNNPWQCDCRMVPFKQRIDGSNSFENQIRCAGPANLQRQYLRDVNPEDLICEETTPVYSTSSTKHMTDSTLSLSPVSSSSPFHQSVSKALTLSPTQSTAPTADSNTGWSTVSTDSPFGTNTGPADGGIVLSVPLLATLGAILGLLLICTIAFAVGCMYKRRQRDPPQQGLSNTNPTGTSSGLSEQMELPAVGTSAGINSQSETSHFDTEDSQHIYNLPTDEDPDTAEYNTIDDIDQSESPHQDAGQIQHLGSFNDGYEVPFPFLCSGEGPQSHKYENRQDPQSHKYENRQVAAAAKDAAAGPQLMVYENEDEMESAKEDPQSHKYENRQVAAAAKDAAAGPQLMVYENEDEMESAKEDPQSHKYVNSQMTAAAKDADAAAGPQVMLYDNDDEVEPAKETTCM
ncbi:PREDICTED: reticulon-4 receptor-like 2 [Branchiostoma belcheri]|uniref:Reticulon-4 receptor-like 2 n=1 Tax=Branchiostoma belcheri TaxID=7741 RepID=A0A6P4ZCG0_BRABE|nr:PREDICTED: reticulon-4 receptor-like 2 [Branchiostoma belcheri]